MRKMSQKSRANISAGMKASWAKRKAEKEHVQRPKILKSLTFGGRIRAAWRMLTNGK
jgi:hypothetical protein